MTKHEAVNQALKYFDEGYACSQAVLLTFAPRYNLNLQTAKLISSTFGGGMSRLREKCGAVTGAFMVIGLEYGNDKPDDMDTKLNAYRIARELDHDIKSVLGSTHCSELLKKHATEAEVADRKHHKIICRNAIAVATEKLYDILTQNKTQAL